MIFDDNQMRKISKIGYEELRGIHDLSKKLSIITIALTAMNDYKTFADLLYKNEGLEYWINRTNDYYKDKSKTNNTFIDHFNVDASVDQTFSNFVDSLKKEYEFECFFKGVYEKDEFALAIVEMSEIFENLFKIEKKQLDILNNKKREAKA